MKTFFLWFGAAVILAMVVASVAFSRLNPSVSASTFRAALQSSTVSIDGVDVHVDLAVTPAAQEQGLGGRAGLAADQGMLFIFPRDGQYAFWMKDMHFPIDIIWLDSTGKVIYIVPNLSPATYPQAFGPRASSRFVLEVPAGFAAQHVVHLGDVAALPSI